VITPIQQFFTSLGNTKVQRIRKLAAYERSRKKKEEKKEERAFLHVSEAFWQYPLDA
jgi:hypothetical protein